MSTRATIHFQFHGRTEAIVYRHSDGHLLGGDLKQFFADVQKQTPDTRFNDPTYLAAKFVVWQAARYSQKTKYNTGNPLDFLGVGVVQEDPEDIEYRYLVACENENHPK